MDIFAHALWARAGGKIIKNKKNVIHLGWTMFWGVFPDLFAFTVPFITMIVTGNFKAGPPQGDSFTIAQTLYQYSHSLVIVTVVFLLFWVIRKKAPLALFGWFLHILIDIPTHTASFFATPLFFPLSDLRFVHGFSWGTKWFMIVNYVLLGIMTIFQLMRKENDDQKKENRNTTVYALCFLALMASIAFGIVYMKNALTPNEVRTVPNVEIQEATKEYSISISYPSDIPPQVKKEVESFVTRASTEFKKIFSGLTEEDKNILGLDGTNQYTLSIGAKEYESDTTKSIVFLGNEYTGGAHGNQFITSYSYTKEEGIPLTLSMLFAEPYTESISKKIREKLYVSLADYDKETIDIGTEPQEQSFSIFYITNDGIVFIFPPYTVGPYSIGVQEISLTWDELPKVRDGIR